MKYLFRISFCLVFMMFFIGAQEKDIRFAEAVKPEMFFSAIDLQNADLKNEAYVLVQLWAAYDPQSRKENVMMHNAIKGFQSEKLQLVSISLDESDAVFQGVIEADKLEKSTQWRISSKRKWNLLKEYSFREDLRNGLIDPQGKMLAKNLNPTEVLEIIASLPD